MSKKCSKCGKVKPLAAFGVDKSRLKGLRYNCKSCRNETRRGRRKDPAVRDREREYRQTEGAKAKKRKLDNERYRTDRGRLEKNLRCALYDFAIRRIDSARNRKLMGCTCAEIHVHIKKHWEPWMKWKNYGKGPGKRWSFDHTIPYDAFPTYEELEKHKFAVCWYENVRPMCFLDNIRKNCEWTEEGKAKLLIKYAIHQILYSVIDRIGTSRSRTDDHSNCNRALYR